MSALILPQRFKQQPQYAAPVDWGNPLASGLASASVFDATGSIVDRVTGVRYPVTNGAARIDKPGRVVYLPGTGYVNTGAQTIGGINLFADSTSQWSAVIYARLENSSITGTFLGKAGSSPSSRTFQIYRDASAADQDPATWIRGAQTLLNWDFNTSDWHQYTATWDGATAKAYGDYDKETVLAVGFAAQEAENIVFGARTGGTGAFLTGRIAYGYFYNRAISRAESIALYENPWQIFKAPARRLWVSASVAPGDTVGSSSGLATVSGVGASVSESTGSSTGLATVSGVSDSASVASAVGSASGTSTVSGVGSSSTAGSSTGSASGSSTVSGVSASVAASVGSASGEAVVTGRAPVVVIEAEFSGGFPYIDHDERKKKQRAKLGIVKEVEHVLKSSNNKDLTAKRPVKGTSPQEIFLAQQEALNAELRRLVQIEAQLEIGREEEAIVRMLMEL